MLTMPFLTDLDSRAAVKGSRDPLGIQQIWTRLGRHVVGNLTTVSNSIRDFTTLLLGYHFAARLADDLGPGTELGTFLKWEQLAAYARADVNSDFAFRGTERVRKNLSEDFRVTISDNRAYQILGNQKIYGLWGLYTMPARASGLLDGNPTRLTLPAREFVEGLYLPILQDGTGKDSRRILDVLCLRISRVDVRGPEAPMVKAVARLLKTPLRVEEREFYRSHLLHGGPQDSTNGRQGQLAELFEGTLDRRDFAWSTAMVANLAKAAQARGEAWHPLAHRLARIRTSETVLGPISALFTHLLGLDGKTVDSVKKRLTDAWGPGLRTVDSGSFSELRSEIAADDAATGDRWVGIASAVAAGDYPQLVNLLIEQNKVVMATRGGTPWIELRQGKLHVRYRDEQGVIPPLKEIPTLWRFSYFLDSLRSVAIALKES